MHAEVAAVIDTLQHPRYEMHGSGVVFDEEEAVRGYCRSLTHAFADLANEISPSPPTRGHRAGRVLTQWNAPWPLHANDKVPDATGRKSASAWLRLSSSRQASTRSSASGLARPPM